MLNEEVKNAHPFSKITKSSQAASPPCRTAREEWQLVHTYEDALKWHLKWTPWFTKDMIEGMLKYAYPCEILKEEHGEEILTQAEPAKVKRRDASLNVTLSPIELRRTESAYPELKKTESAAPKSAELPEKEAEMSPEEIQKRMNRFWTLNL